MFLDNFLIAAEQVAILYILVAVGFIADRTMASTPLAAAAIISSFCAV